MTTHKVTTTWNHKLAFDSKIDNHSIRMDASNELGEDSGPGPKKLLLSALTGCTGMDVVSLLNKMRIDFTNFQIAIEADLTDNHPKVYSEIRIIYKVFGKKLNREKVKKAIELSIDRYCGVYAMLKKNSPINYSIEYLEA